jgi:P-type Ca2+ transporter type 2C
LDDIRFTFCIKDQRRDLILICYILLQVFNEISSREMERVNVIKGILKNYVFMAVLTSTVVFQFIMVQFLGEFANTMPLTRMQWLTSMLLGLAGMPIAAAVKMIPVGSS